MSSEVRGRPYPTDRKADPHTSPDRRATAPSIRKSLAKVLKYQRNSTLMPFVHIFERLDTSKYVPYSVFAWFQPSCRSQRGAPLLVREHSADPSLHAKDVTEFSRANPHEVEFS